MVRVVGLIVLLLVAITAISDAVIVSKKLGLRKFATGKKLKPIYTKFRKGKSWWWTSTSAEEPEEDLPAIEELGKLEVAPLSKYPVWRVHKYKGIELRPVVMVDAPPSAEVAESVPLYPEYSPEPHGEYLPPPELPAVYGPPPSVVKLPPLNPRYVRADNPEEATQEEEEEESPASEEETQSALNALSNLGALTSFLGNGGEGTGFTNIDRLQNILRLVNGENSIFKRLKNFKDLKYSIGRDYVFPGQEAAPSTTSAVYYPPEGGFLSSLVPSFLRSETKPSIPLPSLPEVASAHPSVSLFKNIKLPELPNVELPPYATDATRTPTGPYVRVQYNPLKQYQSPLAYIPTYPSYPALPPTPIAIPHYQAPVYDSYGTTLPKDYYAAATNTKPIVVASPITNEQKNSEEKFPEEAYDEAAYDDQYMVNEETLGASTAQVPLKNEELNQQKPQQQKQ